MFANKVRAEKAAQKFLASNPSDETLVPVRSLAHAAGCLVKLTPLDDDLSGMAFIKDETRAIVVNSSHHPNRQRFTIAHELAHHILHIPLLKQGVHVDKAIFRRDQLASKGTQSYEIEANHFAAELLMPRRLVKKFIPLNFDLQDDERLASFSAMFGVSTTALYYRIQNVFAE